MQLIVAEKPSVARDLARVLGVRATGKHGFETDALAITWCIGHLVELEEPSAYDGRWKAWRLDTLPMLPAEFRLRASKHALDQLRAVTALLKDRRFASVINACDAGREGELIFRYVYQYAGSRLPVHRLWISSLTDEAIRRGFAALRPGAQLDALGDAARSRSEADWLVGLNATRAITVRGHGALYSIGRVQTPTLAMLVERERAIRAFVAKPYWEVRGEFDAGDKVVARWQHGKHVRLGSAAAADAIVARDRAHGRGVVERVRAKTVREPPPLLFDLTALQRTANRRFGFSAARTLELAQALYERHKILTYPRTDSRHLSSDMVPQLPGLFAALAVVPDYAPFAASLVAQPPRPGRRVVDDGKVRDHPAIVPTGNPIRIDALDRDERRLFDLVARRFLGAFYPDAEFAVTEAWIRVGAPREPVPDFAPAGEDILDAAPAEPDRYLARGRVRVEAGWQAVAGIDGARDPRDKDEAIASLPRLVEGQVLPGAFASVAKQTTPPPRYTEATLLAAMEAAGKRIDDEALREAMKDRGLGTPATRASIIETLLHRGYVARDKQLLVPTEMGIGLIDALPVASLASPELTGTWEARLARIARGEESRAAFMADIARYVSDTVDAIRTASPPPAPASAVIGACPRCRDEVRERRSDFACACGFSIRKRIAGRAIAAALAGVLLERRRSQVLRGFRSKAGKKFAAALVLDEAGEVKFEFERRAPVDGEAATGATAGRKRAPRSRRARVPANERVSRPARPRRAPRPAVDRISPPDAATPDRDRSGRPERTRHGAVPDRRAANDRVQPIRIDPQPRAADGADDEGAAMDRVRRAIDDVMRSTPDAGARTATTAASPASSSTEPATIELDCPRCRSGSLMTGSRGWGCSRWRDGCRFVVWFETAGRRLTDAQLRDLVTRGKTRKARFVAGGVEVDGRLVLDAAADDGGARLERM